MDETTVLQLFQSVRNPQLDLFSIFIDVLFSFEVLFLLILVVFLLKRDKWSFSFLFGFLLNGLLTAILKLIFCIPRPQIENTASILQEETFSFPSGHTSNAFFLAKFLAKRRRKLKYSLYALAIVVGIFRIYSGLHYPKDVIFGAIVGYISGFLILRFEKSVYHIYKGLRRKLKRTRRK